MGSQGVRGGLNNRGDDRQETLNSKELNQSGINRKLPQISGESEGDGEK